MSVPEQRAASRTAVGVALLRAMHQLHDASRTVPTTLNISNRRPY